jgi:rhodanese-related sulfurtransferase
MSTPSRISPEETKKLLDSNEGYVYLDVRSTPEFRAGHVPGARCVPVMEPAGGIMAPNARFIEQVGAIVPKDGKLIVGCQHGVRSQRAAAMLAAAGYMQVFDMRGGFEGELDHYGCITYPGWSALGLPVSKE